MTVKTEPTSWVALKTFLRRNNDAVLENSDATLESASARVESAIVRSTVAMEATKMIAVSVYEEQLATLKFVSLQPKVHVSASVEHYRFPNHSLIIMHRFVLTHI